MADKEIEALVKATIQARIIEALNSTPEAVEKLVACALKKEVNESGGEPRSYGEKKIPYLDWLVGEELRRATRAVISDYMAEHKDAIREKVHLALAATDFGAPLAARVAEVLGEDYNWTISLDLTKPR